MAKKSKNVVAGSDLSLAPVVATVAELNDAAGQLEGYATSVRIPIPTNLGFPGAAEAGGLQIDALPKGKRALKAGAEKLKVKALKDALKVVKAQKQFWTYRYQEIKAQANAGKPPRKPRTPKAQKPQDTV